MTPPCEVCGKYLEYPLPLDRRWEHSDGTPLCDR